MGRGVIARDEHHAAVAELRDGGLAHAGRGGGVGNRDFSALPRRAAIVAENRRHDGLAVRAAFRLRQPHRHDQATVPKLDAVAGPGRDHAPRPFRAEAIRGGGDVDGRAPREAVVGAAHVEGAHVFHAINEMHRAIAIGDGHGVVHCLLPGIADHFAPRLLGVGGIAREARTQVRHLADRAERATAIGAAPLVKFDLAPVQAGVFPRLAEDEHRALRSDDEARDTIGNKIVGVFLEEIHLFEERCGRQCGRKQEREEEAEAAGHHCIS